MCSFTVFLFFFWGVGAIKPFYWGALGEGRKVGRTMRSPGRDLPSLTVPESPSLYFFNSGKSSDSLILWYSYITLCYNLKFYNHIIDVNSHNWNLVNDGKFRNIYFAQTIMYMNLFWRKSKCIWKLIYIYFETLKFHLPVRHWATP